MTDSAIEIKATEHTERPQDKGGVMQKWEATDGKTFMTKAEALAHNETIEAQAVAAPALEAIAKLDEVLTKGSKKEEKADDEDEEKEGDDEDTKKEKTARKAKKKEEAEKASKEKADKDEADAAAKSAKEKEDAEKAANEKDSADKSAGKDDKKEPYGDVEYADEGHQKDKKKRYPLDTEEHIRAAWSYVNKKKNADKYDAEDLKSVKAKIVAAWKSKIDKEGPPSASEKAFRTAAMKKGMHEVARMACLIQDLDWLQSCLEMEADWERDNSPLPAELKTQIGTLCGFLRDLVAEETEELFDDDDDVDVMEMAAGLHRDQAEAMLKFSLSEKSKAKIATLADAVQKAGARHGKADMERVQKMHDLAHEMHKCMGDMVEKCDDMHQSAGMMKNTAIDLGADGDKTKEDESKADKAVASELAKMTAKHDALVKVLGDLAPKIGDMLKRVEDQNGIVADQATRIKHLEDQPMPPKGAIRPVEKGGKPTEEAVLALIKGKSKEEIDMLLMKSALSAPSLIIE